MPRFLYWTILLGNEPTAFRARDRDELLPTLKQLQRQHPEAVLRWYERGSLWDSPEAARAQFEAERRERTPDRRGPKWRPGGEHRDPHERERPPRDVRRRKLIQRLRERGEIPGPSRGPAGVPPSRSSTDAPRARGPKSEGFSRGPQGPPRSRDSKGGPPTGGGPAWRGPKSEGFSRGPQGPPRSRDSKGGPPTGGGPAWRGPKSEGFPRGPRGPRGTGSPRGPKGGRGGGR